MLINIRELDSSKDIIQIINGPENVVNTINYCTSSAQETIDLYAEGIGVYSFFHYPENLKLRKEALGRGIRIRYVTEITKDNLATIKEAIQYLSEVRHMETITHNFGVSEKHHLSSKLQYGNPNLTLSIFSNLG